MPSAANKSGTSSQPVADTQDPYSPAFERISAEDRGYLKNLAADTWRCLDWLGHPETGLPYDSSDKSRKATSVSNIGIYAAALPSAVLLGLLGRDEAVARAGRLLESLTAFPHWHGFCQSWHHVETRAPNADDPWISILDSGNLFGGLLVLKGLLPELAARVDRYLSSVDWTAVSDASTHELFGGIKMPAGEINRDWKLNLLGSDSRLASALAIGSGQLDPAHWSTLCRDEEELYGLRYLAPGWQGGGLFMQFISGLFFDELGSYPSLSAARFAYAQIFHGRVRSTPVWGWSASDSPDDGYLGWMAIQDRVVTPHASVLPLAFFPDHTLSNLRALEKLGARAPFAVDGEERRFGFRDAVDLRSGRVTSTYLVLDQGMLFLTLANVLSNGAVSRAPSSDLWVRTARETVADYRNVDLPSFWKSVASMSVDTPQIVAKRFSRPLLSSGVSLQASLSIEGDKFPGGEGRILWRLRHGGSRAEIARGASDASLSSGSNVSIDLSGPSGEHIFEVALVRNGRVVSEDAAPIFLGGVKDEKTSRALPSASMRDEAERWMREPLHLALWTPGAGSPAFRTDDGHARFEGKAQKGKAVVWTAPLTGDFRSLRRIELEARYQGPPARIEIRLKDADNAVFGFSDSAGMWTDWFLIRADASAFKRMEGTKNGLDFARLTSVMVAVVPERDAEFLSLDARGWTAARTGTAA